jgi:membrane protein implicated in regulation of membrane protease activity
VFGGYCLAAAVYIAIGVAFVDFLLSFWVGVAYLVVAAWLVPTLVRPRRRLRRRPQDARPLPVRPSEMTGRQSVRRKGGIRG